MRVCVCKRVYQHNPRSICVSKLEGSTSCGSPQLFVLGYTRYPEEDIRNVAHSRGLAAISILERRCIRIIKVNEVISD